MTRPKFTVERVEELLRRAEPRARALHRRLKACFELTDEQMRFRLDAGEREPAPAGEEPDHG